MGRREGLVSNGGHSVGGKGSLTDVLIFSRGLGQMGSSTFEAAQIISISEHLKELYLEWSMGRREGLVGSGGHSVGGKWSLGRADL